jgi:hypothetical protein
MIAKTKRKTLTNEHGIATAGVLFCSLLMCVSAYASQSSVQVSLTTTALVGNAAGPFSIGIALTDGSGFNAGDSTVRLSNIDFHGGAALGTPTVFGGTNGDLGTSVTLANSASFEFFSQGFSPGTKLTFTLTITAGTSHHDFPDRVTIFIFDGSGAPIATLAPAGDYFLGVDLTREDPVVQTYGSDPSRPPFTGKSIPINAPKFDD